VGTVGALEFPSLVHRLDVATSGLLVVAKTRPAAVNLSKQFATRQVRKTYTALLQGMLPEKYGRIDSTIDDKSAVTEWTVIREFCSTKSPLSLVNFRPRDGRKHQLRRHAVRTNPCMIPLFTQTESDGIANLNPKSENLGCPIVGDDLYGSSIGRQLLLCATEIELMHPFKEGELVRAKIELPRSFTAYMQREEIRFIKYEEWIQAGIPRSL
jgi:23S rRNA-/tRNA-specific pseudouridylate synthase